MLNYVLTQEEMNINKKRKSYLNKILKNAKDQRFKLSGYSTDVTKKLNSGSISEAEAQMKERLLKIRERF